AVRLPERLRRELAAQELGYVASDRMRGPAHSRVVDVAGARERAPRRLAAEPPCPAAQPGVRPGGLLVLCQQLLSPLRDAPAWRSAARRSGSRSLSRTTSA